MTTTTTTTTDKQNDLLFDVYNLSALDTHPIDLAQYKKQGEKYLMEHSRQNTQFLMSKLFELPTSSEEDGLFITLPKTGTVPIPREKPVPKEKKTTAWEDFAKQKNMRLHDKEKLVYDQVNDEFRPRFGMGRANKEIENDWVMEVKDQGNSLNAKKKNLASHNNNNNNTNNNTNNTKKNARLSNGEAPTKKSKFEIAGYTESDPFLEKQQAKNKSKKQQVKNQKKNMSKSQEKTKIPAQLNIAALPRLDAKRARFDLKHDLKDVHSMASVSTASMGKFDKKLSKEPRKSTVKPKNKLSGKAALGNDSQQTDEKQASLKLLDRVLKTNAQKKRAVKSNAAQVFQQIAEQQQRSNKKVHLLGQNKTRFTSNQDKKGGKGKKGAAGKKRGRNVIDF